jgi:predicted metal-dependent HD superfamily phosphohydrolase
MTDLLVRWSRALPDAPRDAADHVGRDLLARWTEPHRSYHDGTHLRAVLDAVDELAAGADDADAVRLAAWFHDAVHAGRAGEDERASAELAERVLPALGLAPARVAEVSRLVRLTATHDPVDGDANGAVLCDADLAVLGGDPAGYAGYAARVRAEYRHVPDEAFAAGRAAVLRDLLAHQPLYRTTEGRRRWEGAARSNLAAEIRTLDGI